MRHKRDAEGEEKSEQPAVEGEQPTPGAAWANADKRRREGDAKDDGDEAEKRPTYNFDEMDTSRLHDSGVSKARRLRELYGQVAMELDTTRTEGGGKGCDDAKAKLHESYTIATKAVQEGPAYRKTS